MRDKLRSTLDTLRRCIGELDASRLTTEQATELLALFAEVERVGVSGKLLVAARAAEGVEWARAGYRSAASWIADMSGTGIGEAIGTLEAAEQLPKLPGTAQAIRRGELSAAQAREIAAAGSANPSAETALLASAANDSFREFRDEARRVRVAAARALDQAEREARIHHARYLRSWTDHDGAFRLDAKVTPAAGAQILATLESRARVHFEEARAAGTAEAESAYLADALVGLCRAPAEMGESEDRPPSRPEAVVHLRVDLAALRRGTLVAGEVCEIPGVGPVSLATARDLIGDSFVKLLVTDGIDVHTVVSRGRTISASVRSALEERDRTCVVPGCGASRFLQIDHWAVDFAQGGPSALWNLARLCPHHHRLKTRGAYELKGGPGNWSFRAVSVKAKHELRSSGADPPGSAPIPPAELLPV